MDLGGWASAWRSTGSIHTLTSLGLGLLHGFVITVLRGPVGGRERALCLPGHGDGAAVRAGEQTATRRPRVIWAVVDGAESCSRTLLAATGGSAIAEAAGVGETRRH